MNEDGTDNVAATEFYLTHRVQYEETDALGVVYHGSYIRYMDHARTEWLRHLGFTPGAGNLAGLVFAVRHLSIEYRKPARFGERLSISASVRRWGRNSLCVDHRITGENGELFCHGHVTLVHLDPDDWRPRRLPENLLSAMTGPGDGPVPASPAADAADTA